MIVLRGTGESSEDPVMFPAHGDGECLDRETRASAVFEAMKAAGAATVDEVKDDPVLAATVLRILRDDALEATRR
ncbi:hypothetical protein [Nocardia altamirensis]|uniref:hypothetical protein n=1 Tax=Nocardia altamirensis TaxID=472158 RepID=UPI00114D2D13|nr:hypothetical protein [Nocardia altamirensis]